MEFGQYVTFAARIVEAAGISVMLGGVVLAALVSVRAWRREGASLYRSFRERLGRAILLGLELLVAADIIRTVSEIPTLQKVVVLAVIVAIRTFLSFALQIELEGRLPWRGRQS
jgi:uncharacterized membrane protein